MVFKFYKHNNTKLWFKNCKGRGLTLKTRVRTSTC